MQFRLDEHDCLEIRTDTGSHNFYLKDDDVNDLYKVLRDYFGDF